MTKEKNNDKYNFLLYVPEIKYDNWKTTERGNVILYFKVTDPIKRFAGWLVKKKPNCDMEFDDRCSAAWLLIDGDRSIFDIAKIMAKKYGDTMDDSIYRLITYMKFLSKKGWITFKKVKEQN